MAKTYVVTMVVKTDSVKSVRVMLTRLQIALGKRDPDGTAVEHIRVTDIGRVR